MPEAVNVSDVPIYLNWSFWAVIIALLALILSQLPHIHILLKRAKLDIEMYSRIHISHKVGNPNLQFLLVLNNAGGRTVKIKGITATVKKDGKQIATLPAQNYLQNQNDKTPLIFTRFSLKPKEEWAHIVNFLNYFFRADEKKYRDAESKLLAEVIEKRKQPQNKDAIIEVGEEFTKVFMEMFKEKFLWLPGEYEMHVYVDAKPTRASIKKDYRFTLFESDSEELSKSMEDYKSGDGIFWDSGNHPGVIVQISEA
jgi:hypothetical protein